MTFTYSDTATTNTNLRRIRDRLGDIVETTAIFTDEQINLVLADFPGVTTASFHLCKMAIAKFARDVDRNVEGISSSRSQQIAHLEILCEQLKAEMTTGAEGFWGGTSAAEATALEGNSDFNRPSVRVGMHDNDC